MIFAIIAFMGIFLVFFVWFVMKQERKQKDFIQEVNTTISGFNERVINILQKNNMDVATRFENSNKVFGDLRSSITKIDESNKRIMELGTHIADLQNILKAPKPRGSLGEVLLQDILSQIFSAANYEMQFHYKKSDCIVDAIIKLHEGFIPIDSKFPLEYFQKMIKTNSESEAQEQRKLFIKMVKKHIQDISDKYVKPSEGSLDFALMYIPAENIYYEAIVRDEAFGETNSVLQYAIQRKVIPVSPNTFYAYLQTILLGLKGMKIEKDAKEIMKNLAKVQKDLEKFDTHFEMLGKNLDRSASSYKSSKERWQFLNKRINKAVEGENIEEEEELEPQKDNSELTC